MTRVDPAERIETVWVPRHPGWRPPNSFTTVLTVVTVVLGAFIVLFVVSLLSNPAPSIKALGVVWIAGFALGAWAVTAQLRGMRPRTVRASVSPDGVRFGRPEGVTWPVRLVALCGVALLAAWLWAFFTAPADDLPRRSFLALPLLAAILIVGAGRSWLPGRGRQALTLTPDGVVVRLPRNNVDVPWEVIARARVEKNRVLLSIADGSTLSWGARDLASDPAILADLIAFYAGSPAARAEIGSATLQRLRDGAFFGADDRASNSSRD